MKLSARGAVSGGAQVLSFTARLIGGRQFSAYLCRFPHIQIFCSLPIGIGTAILKIVTSGDNLLFP